MGEMTKPRFFELMKSSQEMYPVTVDFSDVISAYDSDASITDVEVLTVPAVGPVSKDPLIVGHQVPGGGQKVVLGLGRGDAGYCYEVTIVVTTTIQLPGASTFAKFSAVLSVTVKG